MFFCAYIYFFSHASEEALAFSKHFFMNANISFFKKRLGLGIVTLPYTRDRSMAGEHGALEVL